MEKKPTVFVKGMWVRQPHEKAPDFVKAELSFSATTFPKFLEDHADDKGFVKVTIKQSGKTHEYYAELNQWTKDEPREEKKEPASDIPF